MGYGPCSYCVILKEDLDIVTSLRTETITDFVIVSEITKTIWKAMLQVVAIVLVNFLNIKKYILSKVSENFAVSIQQEASDTKIKSRDLSGLV
jgi:hypothetical protein